MAFLPNIPCRSLGSFFTLWTFSPPETDNDRTMEPSTATSDNLKGLLRRAGLRPPHTLTLAITGACNLQCRHCWVEGGVSTSAAHVPAAKLRRVMQEFADLGGQGLRLTGGEPLCHPEWLELLRFARHLEMPHLGVQTNANLIKKNQAAALRDLDFSGLSIQVSLDGACATSHDLVRGEGAFAGAMAGLQHLIAAGLAPRLSLFFTEMRHNLDEIPALLERADELGIASVVSGSLVRCGRAAEDALIAPAETEQYLRLLKRYETDSGFRALYRKIGRIAALEWQTPNKTTRQDCTFVENPYLTAAGRLYPCVLCHADPYAVSGVFDKPLAEAFSLGAPLWASLLEISRSRAETIPQCHACADRDTCGAGCMGRAWGSCGDFFASEDRCALRRAVYAHRKSAANPS